MDSTSWIKSFSKTTSVPWSTGLTNAPAVNEIKITQIKNIVFSLFECALKIELNAIA